MPFNSIQYLVFLPLVVGLYFALPSRIRWAGLLAASYYFYMSWKAEYAALILFTTVVSYLCGMGIQKVKTQKEKKLIMWSALLLCLSVLFAFKYFNFFGRSLAAVSNAMGMSWSSPALNVLLPVGISFFTFQALSYVIDVYRGEKDVESHFGIFALYVAYFPQLVAGPIERSTRLLPQLRKHVNFDYQMVRSGLLLILWGFFKKVVIADRLAILVDYIYDSPTDFSGFQLIVATVFFSFQIFCDFSAYSDIAIGSARLMGIHLMKNFDAPYFSRSVSEFWKRWHISLSSWFRDYLYIPLGGNRVAKWRWHYNVFVVFVLSGLWHGANWTFVLWGAIHGACLVVSNITSIQRRRFREALGMAGNSIPVILFQVLFTNMVVCIAWSFFRADSLGDAVHVIRHFPGGVLEILGGLVHPQYIVAQLDASGITKIDLIIACAGLFVMEGVHLVSRFRPVGSLLLAQPTWVRWIAYYGLTLTVLFLGYFNSNQQFIYFQF